ncbi:B-cell receptor-associated protein 29 isoform X1 [Arapaima gigas]
MSTTAGFSKQACRRKASQRTRYWEMTLQWTAVASFLYAEIVVLLILCLPFVSPNRWQKIFKFRIWNQIAPYWNKGFLTMIIILIILFLDAVREVRKYSGKESSTGDKLNPNMFDHLHMKLFRAQRNLYISGFSLFLWLIVRRVVTLINQLATALETGSALQAQVDGANEAAKRYMVDNEQLKQALVKGKQRSAEGNEVLKKEVANLTKELRSAGAALKRSYAEVDAMKSQTEMLTKEYDRLLREHQELQNYHPGTEAKKDQ